MSLLHTLLPLWLILLCGTIIAAVFNLGTVAVCLLTGVKYTRIAIFYGKPVITIPTRFGPVVFGYLPFGGYIQLDMGSFPLAPRWKRAAVALSGPLALLLSSLICLGLSRAGLSFLSTYHQFFELVLAPVSKGKDFLHHFVALVQAHPVSGYGVLAAKAGMLNLLPLPALAGGRVLVELSRKRDDSGLAKALNYFGSIFSFAILAWFLYLLIRHYLHSRGSG